MRYTCRLVDFVRNSRCDRRSDAELEAQRIRTAAAHGGPTGLPENKNESHQTRPSCPGGSISRRCSAPPRRIHCRGPHRGRSRARGRDRHARHHRDDRGAHADRGEFPLRRLPGHLALHKPARRPARGLLRDHGDRPDLDHASRGRARRLSEPPRVHPLSALPDHAHVGRAHDVSLVQGVVALRTRRRGGRARHRDGRGRFGGGPGEGDLAQPRLARRGPSRRRLVQARTPAARRARARVARGPVEIRATSQGAPCHRRHALGHLRRAPARGRDLQEGARAGDDGAHAEHGGRQQARHCAHPQGGGRGPDETRARDAGRRRAARPAHRAGGDGHRRGRLHRLRAVPPDRRLPARDAGALRAERVRDVQGRRAAARAVSGAPGGERHRRREEREARRPR